jgi:hypothetical protein
VSRHLGRRGNRRTLRRFVHDYRFHRLDFDRHMSYLQHLELSFVTGHVPDQFSNFYP